MSESVVLGTRVLSTEERKEGGAWGWGVQGQQLTDLKEQHSSPVEGTDCSQATPESTPKIPEEISAKEKDISNMVL